MTKVKVNPGACGLITEIRASGAGKKKYSIVISSDCEMVRKLAERLPELGMMDVFKKMLDNPVYRAGSECLRHVTCPVPCAILKTLEAEAGLAVPRDVSITFIECKGE